VSLKRLFETGVRNFCSMILRQWHARLTSPVVPIRAVVLESSSTIIHWHEIWCRWSYGREVAVTVDHGIMVHGSSGAGVGGLCESREPAPHGPATRGSLCFREPFFLLVYQLSDKQSRDLQQSDLRSDFVRRSKTVAAAHLSGSSVLLAGWQRRVALARVNPT
jgi:hypothetical protein